MIADEITAGPSDSVTFLGGNSEFSCRSRGSASRWLVDDVEFDEVEIQYENERGISITSHGQIGRIYFSMLQVHAREINNNTAVQCATYADDVRSNIAFLRIQGDIPSKST
jgi:hypothetical protein